MQKEESGNSGQNNAAVQDEAVKKAGDYFAGFNFSELVPDINEMFKSGVYFGHQKSRCNPKMKEYIYGVRNGINVIDLEKTRDSLLRAMKAIEESVASGDDILFVGTKKQAKRLVESAARNCAMPYVTERWLGGTFTNYEEISRRTKFLRDGEDKMKRGEYDKYTKFEKMKKQEELDSLEKKMGGIKNMFKLPKMIFAASLIEDDLAIKEAKKKNIPIVALVDTNVDPSGIDFPIPANDDAISSLRLMVGYVVKAVKDGVAKRSVKKPADTKEGGRGERGKFSPRK
jgi:small subunit ribosomal protein S2